ncbi:hypothetical protein EJB05_12316, partial [Eragrostis curvula]
MMVPSAAMRRLRRELDTRWMTAALAPAGGITKKPSPPRPSRCADGDTRLDHAPPSPFVISRAMPPRRTTSASGRARRCACARRWGRCAWGSAWCSGSAPSSSRPRKRGTVISASCTRYTHYKHPRSDPSGAVCVHEKDVKDMVLPEAPVATATAASDGSSTITIVSHSARLPQGGQAQATAVPARRPTTAGKRPSLLKKMEKEMRSKSEAILASW